MITREMALSLRHTQELHYGNCRVFVGPRGGREPRVQVWRVNGACKTWKREPERFSVPIKYGFRGPYGYLTERNCMEFHLSQDCQPTEVQR